MRSRDRESRVDVAGAKGGCVEDAHEERDVGRDADDELAERRGQAGDREVAGLGPGDHLGEQRVVVDGDLAALPNAGIDAQPGHPRLAVEQQRPACGRNPLRRDPRRRRAPRSRGRAATIASCGHGSAFAGRDQQLRAHQIDAGGRFGDRMLDLQPRVHLEEVERRPADAPAGRSTRNSIVPALR